MLLLAKKKKKHLYKPNNEYLDMFIEKKCKSCIQFIFNHRTAQN